VVLYVLVGRVWYSREHKAINPDGTWKVNYAHSSARYAEALAVYVVRSADISEDGSELAANGIREIPAKVQEMAVASVARETKPARTLEFSGYTWTARRSGVFETDGPRSNWWTDIGDSIEREIVDDEEQLRLRITQADAITVRDYPAWEAVELISEGTFGYGTYVFTIQSDFSKLDINAVLGLFTWDSTVLPGDLSVPSFNRNREIDIEVSRWGDPNRKPAHYALPPYEPETDWIYKHAPDHDTLALHNFVSTHVFRWEPDRIVFSSYYGSEEEINERYDTWTFALPGGVPTPGNEKVLINLWLTDDDAEDARDEHGAVIIGNNGKPKKAPGTNRPYSVANPCGADPSETDPCKMDALDVVIRAFRFEPL